MLATFAQAITVHKAQGSQWGSVYVVNETPGILYVGQKNGSRAKAIEQARRWMYTAVSRAEHTVTITAAK
jgi:superfamily I DNA/RNA helicase